MGTRAVRISQENVDFIKSLAKDGESFDDTLSRVIGRSTQMRIRQLKSMEDLDGWIEYLLYENFLDFKENKTSFSEVIELVKADNDYPKYLAKYPQINSKTKNGQTRLAHFIKTKLTRKDYRGKLMLFGELDGKRPQV